LIHDDRKPLRAFLDAQTRYTDLEWQWLETTGAGRLIDRIRRRGGLAGTVATCAYAAARIGLTTAARRRYWIERSLYELLLAYRREDSTLTAPTKKP
jgi:hypothetical protein